MIQYLQHNQIDKEKWDECIGKSINGIAYVYSWYLDAVCKNWSALILNDYEAVFPLALNSKYKISYLYQPNFTRYYGVYSQTTITSEDVNDFFDAIPNNIKFIEFNIHESNKLEREDFQTKERMFQFININRPYQEIFQDYKYDARRTIKNAEKNLKIIENIAPEKIVTLFRDNKGKQLKELRKSDYLLLQKIMNAANSNKCGISLGITNATNNLIAAAFFIKLNNRIIFLKGSANAEGKSSGAMYLIIDSVIKNNAQSVEYFDFGGSSLDGIASFNHKFRANNCVYLQVKKNTLPFMVKLISGKK